MYQEIVMIYEGNPKHKEPWQPGRKGSLCPRDVGIAAAQQMLDESEQVGGKRYATDGELAYCAQQHQADKWHGYPVGWCEVPPDIRMKWTSSDKTTRRAVQRHWNG